MRDKRHMDLSHDALSLKTRIREQDLVDLISDMVEIPSYPGIKNQESAVAEYIRDYFIRAGIEAELDHITDGRCNVYARIPGTGNGRNLLYNGHTDTVPPYDMQDALEPRMDGRSLMGRGSCDMKGSLACMMSAMKIIRESGISPAGDIIFAGVIDEELTSLGTRALLRKGIAADAAIVGEPSDGNIGIGHKGLQWFEFDVHGRAVHGGAQESGINAIRNASRLIQRMEELLLPRIEARKHPLIGASSMNYGYIQGGFQPSTVAGECVLQIDRRWIPGERYDDLVTEIEEIIGGLRRDYTDFSCDFKVMDKSVMEEGIIHEGCEIDTSHPLVAEAEKAFRRGTGMTASRTPFRAWSDAGLLSRYGGIPAIILGPGNLLSAHTDREHLDIDQAMDFVMIFILICLGFCSKENR